MYKMEFVRMSKELEKFCAIIPGGNSATSIVEGHKLISYVSSSNQLPKKKKKKGLYFLIAERKLVQKDLPYIRKGFE